MTYGIMNPQPEQKRAWKQRSWGVITQQVDRLTGLITGTDSRAQRLKQRVTFSDQAQAMLEVLNAFDARKVLEEVIDLTYNPKPAGHKSHWRNGWLRLIKSKYPFPNYHYMIEYEVKSNNHIAVMEIYHDRDLSGVKERSSQERNMLYNVRRLNGMKYDRAMVKRDVERLEGSWEVRRPVPCITTRHAAVNGMLNNLEKAGWLMGVHLDAAYRNANPNEYTLFHNPSEGRVQDFIECVWDKPAFHGSHNARHLASILNQRQLSGEMTEWVVHSQGAIIFGAAVIQHNARIGTPLNKHRVAVHASGAHVGRLKANLQKAQIELVHVHNNPFDLVPNLAGFNNWGWGGLKRSLQAKGLVFGGIGGASPHTLPYIGIQTYEKQLELSGCTREAKQVRRYIAQRDYERDQRRLRGQE